MKNKMIAICNKPTPLALLRALKYEGLNSSDVSHYTVKQHNGKYLYTAFLK